MTQRRKNGKSNVVSLRPTPPSPPSEPPDGPQPIAGITYANYHELAAAFVATHDSQFLLVRDRWVKVPVGNYPPSVREWGAWTAYLYWLFTRGGPPYPRLAHTTVKCFKKFGYHDVPARWPHQFDVSWPEHRSVDAANRYQDRIEHLAAKGLRPDGTPDIADEDLDSTTIEHRKSVVAAARAAAFDPSKRRLPPFRPYPALWAAFEREPEIIELLDQGHSFDFVTEADKRRVLMGIDAARTYIVNSSISRPIPSAKAEPEGWV